MKPIIKKTTTLIACGILQFTTLSGQVGFNNPNPDPSSVLDIKAIDKGILIPRMTTAQRQAMINGTPSPASGLLVFDTDLNRFYFCYRNPTPIWLAVNPWETQDSGGNPPTGVDMYTQVTGNTGVGTINPKSKLSVAGNLAIGTTYADTIAPANGAIIQGNVAIGKKTAASALDVNGTVTAKNYALTAAGNNGPVPSGGIIMWSGLISAIPSGWALCDGTNGTPDLRERFIVGAGLSDNATVTGLQYSVNAVGGNITNSHTHPVDPPLTSSTSNGDHSHGGSTGGPSGTSDKCTCAGSSAVGDGGHTHSFTTNPGGAHTHDTDIASFNSGNPSVTENRPPYFALAFIMKL